MWHFQNKLFMRTGILGVMLWVACCADSSPLIDDAVLIRVENRVTTIREFYDAFEIAKSAYAPTVLRNPEILEKTLFDVLYQLTDELVIMNRADELNLTVSNEELDREVQTIKADYPDDTFEQVLIEQSVSFGIWKEKLRSRLLLEKVIKKDWEDRQTISSDDITDYWNIRQHDLERAPDREGTMTETTEDIVEKLRKTKAQNNYQLWITQLRNRYTIYVDQQLWEKIAQ